MKKQKGSGTKENIDVPANIPCAICGKDTGIPIDADMDEQDPVCSEACGDIYADR